MMNPKIWVVIVPIVQQSKSYCTVLNLTFGSKEQCLPNTLKGTYKWKFNVIKWKRYIFILKVSHAVESRMGLTTSGHVPHPLPGMAGSPCREARGPGIPVTNLKLNQLIVWEHFTTLPFMINTKLCKQRFWPCHENGIIMTNPTIPHKTYLWASNLYCV